MEKISKVQLVGPTSDIKKLQSTINNWLADKYKNGNNFELLDIKYNGYAIYNAMIIYKENEEL